MNTSIKFQFHRVNGFVGDNVLSLFPFFAVMVPMATRTKEQ